MNKKKAKVIFFFKIRECIWEKQERDGRREEYGDEGWEEERGIQFVVELNRVYV